MSEKEVLISETQNKDTTEKKKKKRRRRWWLLPLLFFFPLLWWLSNQKSKGVILETPSNRALAKLTPTGTQLNTHSTGGIVRTSCFSVRLPKSVFNPHIEEKESSCVIRASLMQPRGLVTISLEKKASVPIFTEHTGLQLRLKDPDTYKPTSLQTDFPYPSSAFQTNDELIVFIDHPTGVFIVSLHSLVKFDQTIPSQLKELIQSVTFSSE